MSRLSPEDVQIVAAMVAMAFATSGSGKELVNQEEVKNEV